MQTFPLLLVVHIQYYVEAPLGMVLVDASKRNANAFIIYTSLPRLCCTFMKPHLQTLRVE